MIAQPHDHYPAETLQRLLDDDLPLRDASCIEEHLSACPACRSQMESLAGERSWWHEAVGVLSHGAVHGRNPHCQGSAEPTSPTEACLDWIRPLLEPPADPTRAMGSIDQYQVLEVLGQGGMGVVMRGFDAELNRPVAIKVLAPHLAGVGAARARFMREAQAAANIVHPSIVPIYSVVTTARLPYLVMPCISGGNLQQRIEREGPLDLEQTLRIGVQVAEGLSAAHRQGVIHRDIKPANILIEEGNGRVLISDFGLARALDDASLTMSGMIAGTPQFMSPEQARGEVIDTRTDLFSLGSLLYALSTGRPPYRDGSPLAVLRKISESSPKPIHQVNERIPPWFDQLVSKLMTLDPEQRIASAEAAAQLLRSAHAHVCNPSLHPLPITARQRRFSSRRMAYSLGFLFLLPTAWMISTGMQPGSTSNAPNTNRFVGSQSNEHSDPATKGHALWRTDEEWFTRWRSSNMDAELQSIQQTLLQLESSLTSEIGTAETGESTETEDSVVPPRRASSK